MGRELGMLTIANCGSAEVASHDVLDGGYGILHFGREGGGADDKAGCCAFGEGGKCWCCGGVGWVVKRWRRRESNVPERMVMRKRKVGRMEVSILRA